MDLNPNQLLVTSESQEATDIIGYREAARLLGVPIGTLYAWTHQRKVPHFRLTSRIVKFSRRTLVAWLEMHAVPAEAGKVGAASSTGRSPAGRT